MARDSERYRGARGLCPPLPSLPPSWSTVHPISLGEYERHRRTPVTGLARSLASATSPERIDATRTHSLCRSMRGGAGKGGGLGEGRRGTANKTRLRRQLAAFRPPGQTTSPHDANARERAHAQRRPAPQRGTLALPSPCTPPLRRRRRCRCGIFKRDSSIPRYADSSRSATRALRAIASPSDYGAANRETREIAAFVFQNGNSSTRARREFPLDRFLRRFLLGSASHRVIALYVKCVFNASREKRRRARTKKRKKGKGNGIRVLACSRVGEGKDLRFEANSSFTGRERHDNGAKPLVSMSHEQDVSAVSLTRH